MLDFNRTDLADLPVCVAINDAIERSEPPEENLRQYLGASSIGSECARRIQFDWMVAGVHASQTRDVFRRGHLFEELTRQHMIRAGFVFAPEERLKFEALGGFFRGHADGVLVSGPEIEGVGYPCVWEHKGLGQKGWQALNREGLEKHYPAYFAQVQMYQHFLHLPEHPAVFTAVNANTMARLHVLVPHDAQRAQGWIERAGEVIDATRRGELLPRLTQRRDDFRCKNLCGHVLRCWGDEQAS
jgi:hypothetical protein